MAPTQTSDDSSTRRPTDDEELGMAHLTVVPTNFDPDEAGSRRD